MAAVPVTIIGTITMKSPKEGGEVSGSGIEQCVIQGIASLTGLEVGGGPIVPPQPPPSGAHPSHPIYYPGAHPEHPIFYPPGTEPHPEHPIVIPEPPPTEPPAEGVKPPPPGGGWGYHPEYGWGYFPGEGGKPRPPGGQQPPA